MSGDGARDREVVRVLFVSAHDWFASALESVLEPEGFVFARVRSARHALRHVEQTAPDVVILSERLPDLDAAVLVRSLREAGLRESTPTLVYSPNFWHEDRQVRAMAAGAWDVIREPVRPAIIVQKLRRLLAIGRLIESAEAQEDGGRATGLPMLASLTRSMRRIEATALRQGVPLTCVVLGPSRPGVGSELDIQRAAAAALCSRQVRLSDLCGWVADADFGIVAYDTSASGVIVLVRRLNEVLATAAGNPDAALRPLSAGVVELPAPEDRGESDHRPARERGPNITSLARLAAAQAALREARAGGGGIRIGQPR